MSKLSTERIARKEWLKKPSTKTKKVGMIGKVEVIELDGIPDDTAYLVSEIGFAEQVLSLKFVPPKMFYEKPKWYQWRKQRQYRKLLTTKEAK